MSGYIKYFENGGKNMSFMVKYDNVLDKYNEIQDKSKEKVIKFHSMPVYDETYIKAKVREFDGKRQTFQVMKYQKKIRIILALLA